MFKYVQTCLNHNSNIFFIKTVIIFIKTGCGGEGAGGARRRWSGGGCGGSSGVAGGCSVLVVTGVGFHRYPGVLITIALHVIGLGVECVAVDIVRLDRKSVV